jgi:hypothetical protein
MPTQICYIQETFFIYFLQRVCDKADIFSILTPDKTHSLNLDFNSAAKLISSDDHKILFNSAYLPQDIAILKLSHCEKPAFIASLMYDRFNNYISI